MAEATILAFVVAGLWPSASWGIFLRGWISAGLGVGQIQMDSDTTQAVTVGYLSFGN